MALQDINLFHVCCDIRTLNIVRISLKNIVDKKFYEWALESVNEYQLGK